MAGAEDAVFSLDLSDYCSKFFKKPGQWMSGRLQVEIEKISKGSLADFVSRVIETFLGTVKNSFCQLR
jgi:hypothetical protein